MGDGEKGKVRVLLMASAVYFEVKERIRLDDLYDSTALDLGCSGDVCKVKLVYLFHKDTKKNFSCNV